MELVLDRRWVAAPSMRCGQVARDGTCPHGARWSAPRQVRAARGEYRHDHERVELQRSHMLWASHARWSPCSRGTCAARHAKFGWREVNIGMITSMVGRSALTHAVGRSRDGARAHGPHLEHAGGPVRGVRFA